MFLIPLIWVLVLYIAAKSMFVCIWASLHPTLEKVHKLSANDHSDYTFNVKALPQHMSDQCLLLLCPTSAIAGRNYAVEKGELELSLRAWRKGRVLQPFSSQIYGNPFGSKPNIRAQGCEGIENSIQDTPCTCTAKWYCWDTAGLVSILSQHLFPKVSLQVKMA